MYYEMDMLLLGKMVHNYGFRRQKLLRARPTWATKGEPVCQMGVGKEKRAMFWNLWQMYKKVEHLWWQRKTSKFPQLSSI